MATIEGKPAAQWFKETKARQAKGQFDDKGAREAMQRMQGREMPEYDNQGRIVIGGSGGKYRYQPPPSKPLPTKASQPPPPAKPEPARQVAATPKPQAQATASASKASPQTPAKPAEMPAKRPAPAMASGSEKEWNAKRDAAKQAGRVRAVVRRAEEEGRSSLFKLQAEARAKAAQDTERKRQRESDEWASKNILEKADKAFNENIEKPLMRTAANLGEKAAKAAKSYVGMQAGYLKKASQYLGGDPEAKKRLQAAR